MEFPHLLRLIEQNQFDTIYHEHFSYFSFLTVERVFKVHGLTLFDVETLPTHGGSLRIFGCHEENVAFPVSEKVREMRERERGGKLDQLWTYQSFSPRVEETKYNLLDFLLKTKREKKCVAAYGAPAKGNTLLNYCGIKNDLIPYTVDRSPHKQGRFLPGTHLPIYAPEKIRETKPDYLLVLPWNLRSEILDQMSFIREWGGRFVLPIPELEVVD
jgi:hypothetical protein